jgi:hypothetical protein
MLQEILNEKQKTNLRTAARKIWEWGGGGEEIHQNQW